jgi:hypothetical protein
MTIRGVEIIPPSDSTHAWELAFLVRAALSRVRTDSPSPGDMEYLAQAQRWLRLQPDESQVWFLVQFILGLDCPDGVGIFSDDSIDAVHILAKRAKQILESENPPAFIREQVLYAAGIKEGPRPSDLAMLKGGKKKFAASTQSFGA